MSLITVRTSFLSSTRVSAESEETEEPINILVNASEAAVAGFCLKLQANE